MSKATKRSEDLFAAEIQDRKEEGRRFSAFEVLGIGETSEGGSDIPYTRGWVRCSYTRGWIG